MESTKKAACNGGPKKNLTIRFSDDEIEWLNKVSEKEFRPVAGTVRWILAQYRRGLEAKKECQTPVLHRTSGVTRNVLPAPTGDTPKES